MTSVSPHIETGALFAGRYRIEELLGTGGMGKVYLATDTMLGGDKVALKVLHGDLASDQQLRARFLREVQLTRKVTHHAVVRTFDVGYHEDKLYFTMEYVAGETLRSRISGEPLPVREVIKYLCQILEGLAAIHDLEIIHRDLKSTNVIISTEGEVKITDFGVARPGSSELTGSDELLGSATHIAPESWKDGNGSTLTDIYALGVVAYEMVTGVLPFDGKSAHELMFKHLKQPPVQPVELEATVPRWLNSLILRMLEKDPARRPQSASEILSEIRQRERRSTVEDVRDGASLPPDDLFDPLVPPGAESEISSSEPELDRASLVRSRARTEELPPLQRLEFTLSPAGQSEEELSALRYAARTGTDAPADQTALNFALDILKGLALGVALAAAVVLLVPHLFLLAGNAKVLTIGGALAVAAFSVVAYALLLATPFLGVLHIGRSTIECVRDAGRFFGYLVALSGAWLVYHVFALMYSTGSTSIASLTRALVMAFKAHTAGVLNAFALDLSGAVYKIVELDGRLDIVVALRPSLITTIPYFILLGLYAIGGTFWTAKSVLRLKDANLGAIIMSTVLLLASGLVGLILQSAGVLSERSKASDPLLQVLIDGARVAVPDGQLVAALSAWLLLTLVAFFFATLRR